MSEGSACTTETAGVAKLAYAQDLKSCGPKGPYGFDPRLLHQRSCVQRGSCNLKGGSGPNEEMVNKDRLIAEDRLA